jgi:hypothetical protein
MFFQPFRKLGRSLLAVSAVSLGAASLGAQTPAAPPAGPNPSRADVFLGYSYWSGHGTLKPAGVSYSSVDLGAIGSGAYYFSKYAGIEVSAAFHPDGRNDGLMPLVQAGPIFRLPTPSVTFFGHALAGAARLGGPNSEVVGATYHEPYQWGPALTLGGGMDYDLPFFNHAFGLRLFQADYVYIHEDYGPYVGIPTPGVLGGRANISSAQLSSGILLHLGHIIPPPPLMYACVASPTSVYPGDPITVTGTVTNALPKKTVTYAWTSNGGKVSGTSNVATIDTTGLTPGSYAVKGTATESQKVGQFADCSAPFTVNPLPALSLTCSASPDTITSGGSSTITAMASDPAGKASSFTYSYSPTSGSISGTGSTVTLSTTGAQPGQITITCNASDSMGRTATASTMVTIPAPQVVRPPVVSSATLVCNAPFDKDPRRPVRVDNDAKACLIDQASKQSLGGGSKLILVGNADSSEKPNTATLRAINSRTVLVAKPASVDPSAISIYTGTSGSKSVAVYLQKSGDTLPTGITPVDESAMKPVRHHKKK